LVIADFGRRVADRRLCLLGLVLVFIGYFGPWFPHKTAALSVTGFELAEFAKFFPQVQGGVVAIHRSLFYVPLVVALILLGILASQSTVRVIRFVVPLLAIVVLLATVLPYPVVDSVRHALSTRSPLTLDPQYAGHLVLLLIGSALSLLTPLARQLPRRVRDVLILLLALAGGALAGWQYAVLRPLVNALYGVRLGVGWGLVACMVGFGLLLLSSACAVAGAERSERVQLPS
jgi:hypothetical protein